MLRNRTLWALLGLLWLLAACVPTPPAESTPTTTAEALPVLRFSDDAPVALCRQATQLRLRPVVEGAVWPAQLQAVWALSALGDTTPLASGVWTPDQRDLFVAFPQGAALPPGDYAIAVQAGDAKIGQHRFTVMTAKPEVTDFYAAYTPGGSTITKTAEGAHALYLHYVYDAACPGAPVWITLEHDEAIVCRRAVALESAEGTGVVACYRDDGAPLENGAYRATLALTDEIIARFTLEVGEPPAPPVTYATVCDAPFTAMGLSPEGEPFRPLTRFEWYTQAVYLGVHCRDLPLGQTWEARWFRAGQEVRQQAGTWDGPLEGMVWDSLTGTDRAPFLPGGSYTATLTIAGQPPLSVAFQVIPYTPQP